MRRRLIVIYVTLLAAVLVGLNVPLAIALANNVGNQLFVDRQGDTARFASLAEPALRTNQTAGLAAELRQYDQLFGIAAVIVARDGRPIVASREGIDVTTDELREQIAAALSGQRTEPASTWWPWHDAPLVVAEPVGRGGEIFGAALTVSPTDALAATTWRRWALLAAVSAAVLLAGTIAAAPLANWMLRPVQQLDEAAHALAAGRFGDRPLAAAGPPELQRLTASFNTMAERLATVIERQRSFVSYASHQLRTPLATLRLWVENLEPSVTPAGLDDHRMVKEEIERLGAMCDALLTYARAEATADDVTDVDAAEVADARVAVWSQAAEQAGVRLLRTGDRRALVRAAPQALDQALDALLSNAVKFVGRGHQVLVLVDHPDPQWVDVHVIDDGPGLPTADLAQAAQPFWRAAGHQHVEGSGLGITIADALVTASGGRFDLMPAQPHGLHARIRLVAATP
ncbi:MAG TPA: HAMP domain-containing sensor histidine kinase [Natronosporangium sp.]